MGVDISGSTSADFDHWIDDRVRLSDLDFQRHVTNAVFTTLCADARFIFLEERIRPLVEPTDLLMIANIQVNFLHALDYGPGVRTGTRVASVGNTSLQLEHIIVQSDIIAARSTAVVVRVDDSTRSPVPWTDRVRCLVQGRGEEVAPATYHGR